MKKQTKQLVAALVLLFAVVGIFLLVRPTEEAEAPSTEETEPFYLAGSSANPLVKSLEIRNTEDSFTIENGFSTVEEWRETAGKTHRIVGLETGTLNQDLLESALNTFSGLTAKQVIAESGADLAQYGFSSPQATVTATYEDSSVTLLIGDVAPGEAGTYVALDNTVYLIDRTKTTNLLGSRLAFVNKIATPGNAQNTKIEQATLEGTNFDQPLVIQWDTSGAEDESSGGKYRIISPFDSLADQESGIIPLQSVFGLSADEVVAIADYLDESTATYGLAEPWLHIAVTPLNTAQTDELLQPFEIAFSAQDDSGNVYFQTNRTNYVYRISADLLPFYDLAPFDYQDKLIILPEIDTVSQVELVVDDMVAQFDLSGEDDNLTVRLGGTTLDTESFRSFYQLLLSARYDSEINSDPAEESPQEEEETSANQLLAVTYRYRDGSAEDRVTFVSGPPRKALVSLNEGPAYYTPTTYVNQVIDKMGDLISSGDSTVAPPAESETDA